MFRKVAFTVQPVQDWSRVQALCGETLGLKMGSKSSDGVWTEYDPPGGGCLAPLRTQEDGVPRSTAFNEGCALPGRR